MRKNYTVLAMAAAFVLPIVVSQAGATDFDPSTVYTGVMVTFGAACTAVGGVLAIKYGVKFIKKAIAWLT